MSNKLSKGIVLLLVFFLAACFMFAKGRSQGDEAMGKSMIDKAVGRLEGMDAQVKAEDGKITYVFLSDKRLSDRDLALFDLLRDLKVLSLMNCRYGDRIFEYVKAMPDLEELSLWGSNVTGAGLGNLSRLRLKSLDLRRTKIGDAGLVNLREMKTLEKLELLQTEVTDAGIVHLSGLVALKELGLVCTRVGNRGLKAIAGLPAMEKLELEDTRVTAEGLKHIARLRNLTVLTLHRTAINDDSLTELTALQHLDTLYLCDTPITDKGLRHLERLSRLRVIYVNGTQVSEAGVAAFRRALPKCIVER